MSHQDSSLKCKIRGQVHWRRAGVGGKSRRSPPPLKKNNIFLLTRGLFLHVGAVSLHYPPYARLFPIRGSFCYYFLFKSGLLSMWRAFFVLMKDFLGVCHRPLPKNFLRLSVGKCVLSKQTSVIIGELYYFYFLVILLHNIPF